MAACSLQDRFLFTGLRPDIPALMKGRMDAFLFPSLYEGLPITLLEAQAAGLRCFISDGSPGKQMFCLGLSIVQA